VRYNGSSYIFITIFFSFFLINKKNPFRRFSLQWNDFQIIRSRSIFVVIIFFVFVVHNYGIILPKFETAMKLLIFFGLISIVFSARDPTERRIIESANVENKDTNDDGKDDTVVVNNKDGKNYYDEDGTATDNLEIIPLQGEPTKRVLFVDKKKGKEDSDENIRTTIVSHVVTPKTTTATITPKTTTRIVTEKFAVETITPETTTRILFPNTTTAIITPKTTTGIVTKRIRIVNITPETTTRIVTPKTTTRIFYPDTTTRTEIITPETTTRIVTPETTTGTVIHILDDENESTTAVYTDKYGSTVKTPKSSRKYSNHAVSDRAMNFSAIFSLVFMFICTKLA